MKITSISVDNEGIQLEKEHIHLSLQDFSNDLQNLKRAFTEMDLNLEEMTSLPSIHAQVLDSSIKDIALEANGLKQHLHVLGTEMFSSMDNLVDLANAIGVFGRELHKVSGISREVSEKGGAIVEVVNMVKGIAEQTKLIALNAYIESSRAGEQGLGFNVVSQEVNHLAKSSEELTDRITHGIDMIQDKIMTLSDSADALAQDGERSEIIAKQVAENMNGLGEDTKRMRQSARSLHTREIADKDVAQVDEVIFDEVFFAEMQANCLELYHQQRAQLDFLTTYHNEICAEVSRGQQTQAFSELYYWNWLAQVHSFLTGMSALKKSFAEYFQYMEQARGKGNDKLAACQSLAQGVTSLGEKSGACEEIITSLMGIISGSKASLQQVVIDVDQSFERAKKIREDMHAFKSAVLEVQSSLAAVLTIAVKIDMLGVIGNVEDGRISGSNSGVSFHHVSNEIRQQSILTTQNTNEVKNLLEEFIKQIEEMDQKLNEIVVQFTKEKYRVERAPMLLERLESSLDEVFDYTENIGAAVASICGKISTYSEQLQVFQAQVASLKLESPYTQYLRESVHNLRSLLANKNTNLS